jgi:NAD(P)-dependent dehydrogenase (short-subunit alcohol dehydrogenase family)
LSQRDPAGRFLCARHNWLAIGRQISHGWSGRQGANGGEGDMAARVLVTAGASGIGLEIARAFRAAGAGVYICDIDQAGLDRARAGLPGVHAGLCDVSHDASVEAMVAEAAQMLGGIDVLVNNAGIGGPTRPLHEMEPADWQAVLDVNLTGTFNVTRHAIPHLIAAGGGSIINMSSAAGRFGYPNRSPYATTKWGLIGLTKTLSMELGEHGIRVNAIAPGAVMGERMQRVFEGRVQATGLTMEEVELANLANQSLKYFVDPADIAALALFLASDAGKSISGQILPIDGDHQRN